MAFLASGIRKAELARRLGIPKTTVDRLFDLDRHTRLDQIEAAFAALGKAPLDRNQRRGVQAGCVELPHHR